MLCRSPTISFAKLQTYADKLKHSIKMSLQRSLFFQKSDLIQFMMIVQKYVFAIYLYNLNIRDIEVIFLTANNNVSSNYLSYYGKVD